MLINKTIEKLKQMRLGGMAECLSNQASQLTGSLSFEERLGLLVDYEWTHRQNRRLARLLKGASLKISACLEDIDYHQPQGLGRGLVESLSTGQWLLSHQNVLVTGPSGVGKTYLICALANQACRQGFSARCYRVSRLTSDLSMSKGDGSYPKLMNRLANFNLLVLDDWGLAALTPAESRDILDIIDDRCHTHSTILASQLPLEYWHETMADPTVADAVLDRLVHNAHKFNLKGESMRKLKSKP